MELGMVEYVAMSKASLAWVAWRERRLTDAEADAGEALQMWHGMEDPYGFDWMALWPLTAMAVERDEIGKAIEAARALFGPNQHPLPPELAEVARRSIEAWDKGEMEAARTTLTEALEAAERAGQL
jgi:hypothetical protein